jgi:hypothetical protein
VTVTDIDFDLTQQLDEFYGKLARINEGIRSLSGLGEGVKLYKPSTEGIKRVADSTNALVGEVSKETIVSMKNKVNKEIVRLRDERQRILGN